MQVGDYVRCGRECHRITAIEGEAVHSHKVPPPRRLTVPIFGRGPVPFGRRADVLAQLPADVDRACLAWVEANPRDVFGGDYLYAFAAPLALRMAREPASGQRKYSPAVKVTQ